MAENPFFNRVDERNGSVIMDISDTTATSNDVLAGKKFYSASGAPSTGTLAPGTITEVRANGTSVATSGVANIPAASTSGYGVTKLNNTTSSTSTSEAATAAVAKQLNDKIGNVEGPDLQSQVDLLSSKITTATVELGNDVSLPAGNFELIFRVGKTGYTPVGIIAYNLYNRGIADKIFLSGMTVSGNAAVFYGKVSENITISASANVTIIYIKS